MNSEENNGYDVVFKGNIHGSAWKKGGGMSEGLLRPSAMRSKAEPEFRNI
jgi:hypothetical protein